MTFGTTTLNAATATGSKVLGDALVTVNDAG